MTHSTSIPPKTSPMQNTPALAQKGGQKSVLTCLIKVSIGPKGTGAYILGR